MELSSALFVPAPSAVETAATCMHSDIHALSITKNRHLRSGSLIWATAYTRTMAVGVDFSGWLERLASLTTSYVSHTHP